MNIYIYIYLDKNKKRICAKYKEKKKRNKFKRKYSPNLIILDNDYLYNVPPNQCSFVELINIYYKKNIF